MGFQETVQYLFDLQKFGTKLGLDNTFTLLELLGRPDKKQSYLHITGTNGKGSVSAFCASALARARYRTGLYTSPHLVSFTERIRVDGRAVSEDGVVALAERLKSRLAEKDPGLKPTFFEFTTAMALEYFAKAGTDIVVLEVGMGGRLDSTNVVMPECTAITNVEMEHREYLGDTLEAIAFEKAGIIKPGVPLVTSEKKGPALRLLAGRCRELGSDMLVLGRDYGYEFLGARLEGGRIIQALDYSGPGGDIKGLEVPLAGAHQLENAATAICGLQMLAGRGFPCDEEAIRAGLLSTRWEGRLEIVSERPLLVLDGAHNPASATRLAESLKEYFAGRYRKLILVLGVLSDKEPEFMMKTLAPFADEVVFTQAEYERAVPADDLMSIAAEAGIKARLARRVSGAVASALAAAAPEDMVLVAGSLYVVGEAKAWLEKKEQFLKA